MARSSVVRKKSVDVTAFAFELHSVAIQKLIDANVFTITRTCFCFVDVWDKKQKYNGIDLENNDYIEDVPRQMSFRASYV